MTFIDEKGRIWGSINIIDLTVLIFFIFLISGFLHLLYTRDLFRDFDPEKKEYIKKEVDLLINNPEPTALSDFEKSTQNSSMISEGFRIINITSIKPTHMTCTQYRNSYTINILAELNTHLDQNTHTYYYKDNQIIKGLPLEFELNQKKIIAQILEVK